MNIVLRAGCRLVMSRLDVGPGKGGTGHFEGCGELSGLNSVLFSSGMSQSQSVSTWFRLMDLL